MIKLDENDVKTISRVSMDKMRLFDQISQAMVSIRKGESLWWESMYSKFNLDPKKKYDIKQNKEGTFLVEMPPIKPLILVKPK